MNHITTISLHERHREWLQDQDDYNLSANVRAMIDGEIAAEELRIDD